ncbi:hypothetical protein ILYODFUR_012192 [Ilyodon furcidens]|uniref:Uncharacterized protein n=1 Tax=Ilyodon furcidens TaxID=33524 RepID=A0ABV0UU15_9TELE
MFHYSSDCIFRVVVLLKSRSEEYLIITCLVKRLPHLSSESMQLFQSYHGALGCFSDYHCPCLTHQFRWTVMVVSLELCRSLCSVRGWSKQSSARHLRYGPKLDLHDAVYCSFS